MISSTLVESLDKGAWLVSPTPVFENERFGYVLVKRKVSTQQIQHYPDAIYIMRWIVMSQKVYQAYLEGNDVGYDAGEHLQVEFAANIDELETLLLRRLPDLNKLTEKSQSLIKYPT